MKQFFNILQICRYEFIDVFHDRGVLIFIIFVPIFYPLLYSYVYTNEVVREVPVAVVDENRTNLSRELLRYIDATPDIKIRSYCNDMEEARDLVKKSKAYGIIRIPYSFTEDLSRGDQAYIGAYCDMSSMLYYKGIVLGTNMATFEKIKDIKIQRYVHGTTNREDEINKMPIDYEEVALFNPQSGFASFLIPPVLMLIIQQTLLLGIGMSMGRIRERNDGFIIPLKRAYKNPFNIVVGKMLFYFFIYIIMAIYMYTYVNKEFALPCIGGYDTFLAFIVPFILSCIFFSMVFSAFVYRREDCIMLFVFISVPLLFMSGVSWPGSAIPRFWKIFSYIFPSTFGMNGYVRISSMGAILHDVKFEYQSLWIQVGVYFVMACLIYRYQIKSLLSGRRKHPVVGLNNKVR
jgi:ABC-2 type transport system permease protein